MTEPTRTDERPAVTDDRPGAGRPMPTLLAGALLLAVPTVLELVAPAPTSSADSGVALTVTVLLAIGAAAVVLATLRPRAGVMPALAVLCTALSLILVPPEPIWDGVCGCACLLFLLGVRLNRRPDAASLDLGGWFARHRPMLVGAAVTTPAAVVAAEVPGGWSLPVAAVAGLVSGGICLLLLRDWT
jgi:hypothetical protein